MCIIYQTFLNQNQKKHLDHQPPFNLTKAILHSGYYHLGQKNPLEYPYIIKEFLSNNRFEPHNIRYHVKDLLSVLLAIREGCGINQVTTTLLLSAIYKTSKTNFDQPITRRNFLKLLGTGLATSSLYQNHYKTGYPAYLNQLDFYSVGNYLPKILQKLQKTGTTTPEMTFFHGQTDVFCPFSEAEKLHHELKTNGLPTSMYTQTKGSHSIHPDLLSTINTNNPFYIYAKITGQAFDLSNQDGLQKLVEPDESTHYSLQNKFESEVKVIEHWPLEDLLTMPYFQYFLTHFTPNDAPDIHTLHPLIKDKIESDPSWHKTLLEKNNLLYTFEKAINPLFKDIINNTPLISEKIELPLTVVGQIPDPQGNLVNLKYQLSFVLDPKQYEAQKVVCYLSILGNN